MMTTKKPSRLPIGKLRIPPHWQDETSTQAGTKFAIIGHPIAPADAHLDEILANAARHLNDYAKLWRDLASAAPLADGRERMLKTAAEIDALATALTDLRVWSATP